MSQAPSGSPRLADADASAMATRRAPQVDLYLDAEVTRPQGDDALKAHLLTGGGARIGRFRILRQLGEGGMGLIFAARDAELNREVALKILRPRERDGALSRARMVREAQALARLSHANVVTVYEVGEHEGHVFIAMELVHGRTLAGWLSVKRPGWRAIVAVFAAAGRGLAAAHRAGIIHRDFKPTNVIVGRDGRVTVIDFGIAIAPGRADTGPLTLAGTISGTPSYMAPEQVAGAPVDPRADQYAFATSLYEALVGERPYKGSSLEDRLRELLTEPQPTFPKGTRLPRWLQRAVLRGLAQDPDHRFPSMDELIAALERDPKRPRRYALFAGAAIALAAAGYGVAYQQVAPDSRCDAVDAELADAWNEARAAAVEAALQATDVGFADDTFARLAPLLDGYRDRWIDARRGACVANLAGALPTDLYGLEVACLDQQRRSFAALTSTLTEAHADAVEQALHAARQLPAPARCSDVAALTAAIPTPDDPAIVAAVSGLRDRLKAAEVDLSLARTDEALAELDVLCARADELAYLPLIAEAHALRGRARLRAGDLDAAEDELREALWSADQVRDDVTLAAAMAALLRLLGERGRHGDALAWTPHAAVVLARLGDRDPIAAELSRAIAKIHYGRGDADAALTWLGRARALAEAHGDAASQLVLDVDADRAAVLTLKGDAAAAQALSTAVLEARIASLGPTHPAVATSLANVGAAHAARGDFASALPYFERALEIREAALGSEHPSLGAFLSDVGRALAALDRGAEARPYLERALAIDRARLGEEHPDVAAREHALGVLLLEIGDLATARPLLERVLERVSAGPHDGAAAAHPSVAAALYAVARVDLLEGSNKAAKRRLQRALKVVDADAEPLLVAEVKRLLAALLREGRKTRGRGDQLAAEALAAFRAIDPQAHAEAIAELEAWIGPADPGASATPTKRGKKRRTRRR